MEKQSTPSMADVICEVRKRKIKSTFFTQINTLIDWSPIKEIINKHYTLKNSATGQKAYDGLQLFKICLLQTWYGLSDYEVEERLNDSISFSAFCNMSIDQVSPDHSTISRFRSRLTKAKAYDSLLHAINDQLEAHSILVKTGALVDASIIDSPLKPKKKATYKIAQDRQEQTAEEKEQEQKGKQLEKENDACVDTEASWVVKGRKVRYGYKKHHVTDNEGLVLGGVTTKASLNEISNLEEVLDSAKLPKRIPVRADKGYQSKKQRSPCIKRVGG